MELIPIKTKVNDSFIYFLTEPNLVFVYHIERLEYITMSDFMNGLHKFEMFEINHVNDFEAFDHREIQPIEGRQFFINQDGMNEMVEEINEYIQKARQVKGEENQFDTVHLVTSESAAGSLRVGLEGPKTVFGFPDSFSIGPLWKLDEKAGRNFRKEWLYENINYGLDEFDSDNKISNTLREIEDIADDTAIYVWHGNNANEQTSLRFFLYILRNKTNEIFLVNTAELSTGKMDAKSFRLFFENGKDNTLLADNERNQFHREWEKISETKDVLRLWLDNEIKSVPTCYYDSFILETIKKLHEEQETKDFIKTGNVLGEIVERVNEPIDIFFLEYRIRYLVYSGALELKGIPKSMHHYSVKHR